MRTTKGGGGGTMMTKKKGSLCSVFMHADDVDKLLMAIGFFGAVLNGVLDPATLLVANKIMNNIGRMATSPAPAFSHIIDENALNFCYFAFGQMIASFLEGYCWTRTAERQASKLRAAYLKAVLRQEVGYFDLQVTGKADIIASVSNDSLIIQEVISEKVPMFLMNLSSFISAYCVSFILCWRLTIVGLPFVIFLVLPGIIYGRFLMGITRKMGEEYNKAGTIVEQAISSIRTVYSFVGETKTVGEYSASLQGTCRFGIKQGLAKGLVMGNNGIGFAIWSFLSYYGSRLVMYHGAQGGTIFTVGAAINIGGLALGFGLSTLRSISEARTAGERIMEVIKRLPKIDSESMEGEILPNVSGEVEFKHVEFAYPSRPESIILEGFNLKIPARQTVAMVGGSGSGKSTAIALLQRYYDPTVGEILVDGVRIEKLQLKWLRSQMGLVSQEPSLFATSIKENILFGKEDASIEDVIEAAKASNAHNFICQFPKGYDTQVGESGIQVSGGQKQRIAIARAIVKSPKILLLDEATSALDAESERVVQRALDKATVGRTTIIVAHRLSTIRNADLIAVVQGGRVMETGSHDQLVRDENGLYASLVRLQQTESSSHAVLAASTNSNRSDSANSASPSHKQEQEATRGGDEPFPVPSFERLLAMNIPEWRYALAGCLSALLCGTIQPTYSYIMGMMISVYFSPDHREIKEKTEIYALCILGLAVFSVLISVCQHYNFAAMGEFLTMRIRERMLSKILSFEIGWFDRGENATGAVCSRLAKDANVVRSLVGDRMSLLLQTISAVFTSCIMGLIISWRLALVIIACQPIIIISLYWRSVVYKSMSKKSMESQHQTGIIAAEVAANLRTIAAFNSQPLVLQMLEKAQEGPRRQSIRQSWSAGIGLGTCNSLLIFNRALYMWYGGVLVGAGSISAKAFYQTFMILVSTGRVIAEAARMTNDIAKGADAVGSVFDVLDRKSLIEPEDQDGRPPDQITGQVELLEIDFAYPSRPDFMAVREFSLEIEAAKSTALVGKSGSGKSTIISLIQRFYDPSKGVVKIDGRDIKSYQLRALRKHMALVSQEPTLFSSTIRENIAYGATVDIDESEIIEAAKLANAHEFIAGLKEGYDTWCGDKGTQLSGGQKQRIAIARAVLKNPAILLLDEATSALDSQSERVVQDALERVMAGRTSVVVAHRLSTIRKCDTIAVLEEGQVVEKGSHSSLLAKGSNGAYVSLVSLQTTPSS